MANIKFAENVRSQIDDAIKKGAKPLIDTKQVFPNDKVRNTLRTLLLSLCVANYIHLGWHWICFSSNLS